ncbi:MAG: DUF805 domain-containing protein [Treponemataceae bacterium]|nr:DUF805 domain-containing protein [Treponemataceae bacterium]
MSPEYVGFFDAIKLFFRNYTNFKGRSTRSEYWWWALAMFIIAFVLTILQALTMYSKLSYLFSGIQVLWGLAIVIPSIALSIRRLHDVGRSGWWFLSRLWEGLSSWCSPSWQATARTSGANPPKPSGAGCVRWFRNGNRRTHFLWRRI